MKLGDSDMTCWTKFVFINKFIQYVFDLSFTMTMNYSTVWGAAELWCTMQPKSNSVSWLNHEDPQKMCTLVYKVWILLMGTTPKLGVNDKLGA